MITSSILITIIAIIVLHWYADFVKQTDWQAQNKSSNNWALSDHVWSYTVVWNWATAIYVLFTGNFWMLLFPLITFVCHWITDYFTSRINKKLWEKGDVHNFFVSVGFDQVLHYVQLFLTYYFLSNV